MLVNVLSSTLSLISATQPPVRTRQFHSAENAAVINIDQLMADKKDGKMKQS